MSRVATAYHEAGHAVLATIGGIEIEFVSITPDSKNWGVCQCEQESFCSASPALRIAFFCAGPIAEAWYLNASPKLDGDDRKRVLAIINEIHGSNVDPFEAKEFKAGYDYAVQVITEHVDCLRAAVNELLDTHPAKCRNIDSVILNTFNNRPKQVAQRLAEEKKSDDELERLRNDFNAGNELSQDELERIGEAVSMPPRKQGLAALYDLAFNR